MKMLTIETANKLINFAKAHNAIIESKKFKEFKRIVINAKQGIVAVRIPLEITEAYYAKTCELKDFNGFNNKKYSGSKRDEYSLIEIKNYNG